MEKLSGNEQKEWDQLAIKSQKHGIGIKRVGPANIVFPDGIYAQLGNGNANVIMDARISLKKKYPLREY